MQMIWYTILEWMQYAISCCMKCRLHKTALLRGNLMVERINSDLANILGNLVSRTISMSNKYFGGLITNPKVNAPVDEELISLALDTPKRVEKKMNELRVGDAIDEIFTLLRRTNKYIDETTPWVLGKDETQERTIWQPYLYNLLESIRFAAVLLESYMPANQ